MLAHAEYVTTCLERHGYTADSVTSAQAALRRLKTTSYRAAIVDIVMPDKDGIELVGEISEQFPELHIIGMTGCAPGLRTVIKRLLAARGVVLLAKPIDPDTLLSSLSAQTTPRQ
jgi:CheY-like chemotaxis protein